MPCKYFISSTAKGKELVIDLESCNVIPPLEDSPECMRTVFEILMKIGEIDSLSLVYGVEYYYSGEQIKYLNDYRNFLIDIYIKENFDDQFLEISRNMTFLRYHSSTIVQLKYLFGDLFLSDPIQAYIILRRIYFREKASKVENKEHESTKNRILFLIEEIMKRMEKTLIISKFIDRLSEYKNRNFYREIFHPIIRPVFMKTKIKSVPEEGILVESYSFGDRKVDIYKPKNSSRYLYYITPPEYMLSKDEIDLLTRVRDALGKLRPSEIEYIRFERLRDITKKMVMDLIKIEAKKMGLKLSPKDIERLSEIMVKLSIGFGIIEDIAADDNIEDIYINPPIGEVPIIVKHNKYGEMETNIIPSVEEVRSWISKIRLISGRPLDEAHPVLDYDITLPEARIRVAVIQEPFSPKGYAMAIRRHRRRPWTFPLFIKNKMLSSFAAALLWFMIDGGRSFLIGGTRGAGKTSLLSALMVQISRRFRIITIEDTLELPVDYFRKLGYNILSLKVRSAVSLETAELSAEDGIRTSLRLGDSCLIIGEVRSLEARALYEAMRVGAMANVVAGTIHGDSPYSIFDRVVNDIGVPPTSFKATDVIVIANKIRTPGGLREYRRVIEITEVRKHWKEDPLLEGGFVTLMRYDAKKDIIEPTSELIEGDSEVLKAIASRVKEFVGRWDRIWENILLRQKIFEELIKLSEELKTNEILEADFIVLSNDIFANVVDEVKEEFGEIDSKEVFNRWKKRFLEEVKRRLRV